MFTQTTNSIKVTATPHYLAEQSDEDEGHFVWAYTIEITNMGTETVQLLNRYWHITDARGVVHEVRGPGVVGEQPVLKAGESFRYTSGTHLHSPSGIMRGTYQMVNDAGEVFDIDIPAFSLDTPEMMGLVN